MKVQGQVFVGSIVCVHHYRALCLKYWYSIHRYYGFSENGKIKNLALESHPTEKPEDPLVISTKALRIYALCPVSFIFM